MSDIVAIEAGGTKFVLAWGSGPDDLHDRVEIATESPDETMPKVIDFIQQTQKKTSIAAIGAAVFGPLELNRQAPNYGSITTTTKLEWRNFDFVGCLQQACDLPVGFDTDVNGAAMGEWRWGAAQGLTDFLYLTVGTGIGGGGMSGGKLLHGAMHPEMGHILIPQDLKRDSFAGICHYHQNCLEGLASGPAIKERWHVGSALDLPPGHEAWELEASYLSAALMNYTMTLAPQRIVIGGGVMRQQHLLPLIRSKLVDALKGYISNATVNAMNDYVVSPGLVENSGVCGAIALGLLEQSGDLS
jgi:fructokinase